MINAIAVDDELPALHVIEEFSRKIDFIQLQKTFIKPVDAQKYLASFPVDLLFLDINMPSITGIELYKSIPQKTMVIFTTAYSEYAVEGFNLNAIDYLLKPFSFERFQQAVTKAAQFAGLKNKNTEAETSHIFVRVNYSLVKIDTKNILFIEGLDDYLKIHVLNQNPVIVRMTMKAILEKLPQKNFIRVHRSFIVSLHHIDSVRNKTIKIASHQIPLSNNYEENFFRHFNK